MSLGTTRLFIEPLDVLFLRGNKLFGDPGSFGESLVPPWPSVAAGAIRSRLLADESVDLAAFARGEMPHPQLGTLQQPGPFAVTAFHLARRLADGTVEVLYQPPADLVITEADGQVTVKALRPQALAAAITSSAPLALAPVLAEAERTKPASGYWLTASGWRKYLRGETPDAADLVRSGELWSLDHRVGVGLEAATRRAAEGRLFSVQAVAMRSGIGFLAVVSGGTPPQSGTVRLGGDGRAAALHPVSVALPEPDYDAIAKAGRCRLVLTSPGLFARGWLPTGAGEPFAEGASFELGDVRGRIVCAAVPRAEVISGWDLARWQPKPAQRAAPAGSVWWLELDAGVTADGLRKLVAQGLWSEPCEDAVRRAEGFNRIQIAAY